jgi:hypothetical protein
MFEFTVLKYSERAFVSNPIPFIISSLWLSSLDKDNLGMSVSCWDKARLDVPEPRLLYSTPSANVQLYLEPKALNFSINAHTSLPVHC